MSTCVWTQCAFINFSFFCYIHSEPQSKQQATVSGYTVWHQSAAVIWFSRQNLGCRRRSNPGNLWQRSMRSSDGKILGGKRASLWWWREWCGLDAEDKAEQRRLQGDIPSGVCVCVGVSDPLFAYHCVASVMRCWGSHHKSS